MEFIIACPEHLEYMWRITLDAKAQLKGLGLDHIKLCLKLKGLN